MLKRHEKRPMPRRNLKYIVCTLGQESALVLACTEELKTASGGKVPTRQTPELHRKKSIGRNPYSRGNAISSHLRLNALPTQPAD